MKLSLEVKYSVYFAVLTVVILLVTSIFLRLLSIGDTIVHSLLISILLVVLIVVVVALIKLAQAVRFYIWCRKSVEEEDE